MPFELKNPLRSKERILIFGHEGTGKSTDFLHIAAAIPGQNFYVVDNDNAYDRLVDTFQQEHDVQLSNVFIAGQDFAQDQDPYSWDGFKNSLSEAMRLMDGEDWLSVDMLSKAWDNVQEWFIESIFQEDIDDYFLKVRMEKERMKSADKSKKSLGALEGWMDWPVINQTYHKRVSTPLLRCPGHLFCVSEAQKLSDDDDKGIKELYGPIGARPKGQKRSGHIMQTVIMQGRKRGGEFTLTGVKDRGRGLWNGEVMENFALDYLVNTAGWERKFVKPGQGGQ